MNRIPLWLPFLLPVLAGCHGKSQEVVSGPVVRRLESAPKLDLEHLDGKRWVDQELSKGTYLIEFWATWCSPCQELSPKLERIRQRYEGEGLRFLAVTEETKAVVSPYSSRHPARHSILLDRSGEATKAWGVRLLPTVLLVRSGRILGRWEGADSAPAIESALEGIYGR